MRLLTFEHLAGFGRVPFSELGRVGGEKKEDRKIDSIAVKPNCPPTTMSGGLKMQNMQTQKRT